MAKWCPSCGAEYVEGIDRCPRCDVGLSELPPRRRRRGKPFTEEDAIFIEPRAARTHSDPFLAVWEGPTDEGMGMIQRLEGASIPVDTGEAAEAGRLRIEVPRSYVNEAYAVMDAADESVLRVPDDPSTLFEAADAEVDADALPAWPPWVRYAVAVVAVVLVIVLLL